jgi:hypothetical protein
MYMSGARPLWASSSAKNIRPARKIYAIWAYMPGEMGRISWGIYYVASIFMDLRSATTFAFAATVDDFD